MEEIRFKNYFKNLFELREFVESLNKIFIIILHQYPSESQVKFTNMLIEDKFIV